MNDSPILENVTLGDRVLQIKLAAASQATQMFLEDHPDWLLKYGDKARVRGVEDAQHHIEFLAGALEADSPQVFEDYCTWAASFMESRGIATCFLLELLTLIEKSLCSQLSAAEQTTVVQFIEAGRVACNRKQPPSGELDASVLESELPASDPISASNFTQERD